MSIAARIEHLAVFRDGHAIELAAAVPRLVLDVGELGVVLVVLLVFRSFYCHVPCSFHCWDFRGDIIALSLAVMALAPLALDVPSVLLLVAFA